MNIFFLKFISLRVESFLENLENLLASLVFLYNFAEQKEQTWPFILSSGGEQKSAKTFAPKSLSALEGISLPIIVSMLTLSFRIRNDF